MSPEVSETINHLMTWLQLVTQIATVATLAYTFSRFMNKPNVSQNQRLDELEAWRGKVEARLNAGNDHFQRIDDGNIVTQKALLALIEHAINGNDIDRLKEAKDDLNNYLVGGTSRR